MNGISDMDVNRLAWRMIAQFMLTGGFMVGLSLLMGGALGETKMALGIFAFLWILNALQFFQIEWEFKRMGERITALEAANRNAEAPNR